MKKVLFYVTLIGVYLAKTYYVGSKLGELLGDAICEYAEKKTITSERD